MHQTQNVAAREPVLRLEYLKNSVARKFTGGEQDKKIGLEIEFLPLQKTTGVLNQPLELSNNKKSGVCDLIRREEAASRQLSYAPKDDGSPQFSTSDNGYITFEPGGQIEYSSSVNSKLAKGLEEVRKNIDALDNALGKYNIWFFFGGINPWHSVSEIGLQMKKPRYRAMDKYLQSVGAYGRYMMRLTTSTQVNLDFGDRDTARERWIAANLLSPVMTAIFSNSPYVCGRYSGAGSFRSVIWQNLDKSRTGFPHIKSDYKNLSPEEQYLEFALKAKVIKLPDKSGELNFLDNNITFKEWLKKGYNGFFPKPEDWEYHLTTLFPEARAKKFIEFRALDGQSKAWWAVPAILMTILLYDYDSVKKVTDLLSPYYSKLDIMLKQAAVKGVKAFPDIAKKIFQIALNSRQFHIDGQLLEYCERFFKSHTWRENSPADHLLQLNNFTVFSPEQYLDYEIRGLETANPPDTVMLSSSLDISPEKLVQAGEAVPILGNIKDDSRSCLKNSELTVSPDNI